MSASDLAHELIALAESWGPEMDARTDAGMVFVSHGDACTLLDAAAKLAELRVIEDAANAWADAMIPKSCTCLSWRAVSGLLAALGRPR